MSFYEKIRLNFPLYFTLSLIFSVAIWSLWAPNWFEDVDNSLAAPITSFSTPVNTSPQVPSGADVKLAYYNGTYAIAFASSSVTATSATTTCAYPGSNPGPQACKLFFTKSYDGGVTWSSPTLVSSNLAFHTDRAVISSLSYDERRGVWVILYKEHGGTGDIVQAYSSNGSTWTVNTVISDNSNSSAHYLGKTAAIAFSTSSDLRAVLAQRGHDLVVGTTTNTGLTTSWPTSSIVSFKGSIDTNSNSYEGAIRPMGISIDGANNIHVVYAMASTTASFGYQIMYASSTNLGQTWSMSSVSGVMSAALSAQATCFECGLNAAAIDPYTGRLSVVYYQATAVNMSLIGSGILSVTTSLKYGQLGANGAWSTSTLSTQIPLYYSFADSSLTSPNPTGLVVPYTGMYAAAIFATNSNPYYRVNTTTAISEQIDSTTLFNLSEMSLAYNSSTKSVALAYVDASTYRVKFSTSSLKVAQVNDAATTTAMSPTQASNATGIITASTVVSDENGEPVTLYVDYSLDHGATWTSSTIASASGSEQGSLTTATGKITNISLSEDYDADQVVQFTWDTSVILAASSTSAVRLRVMADDGYSNSGYRQTASFTVDNLAPGVPSDLVLSSVESTSLSLLWTASTGTPTLYLASSTAQTATATSTSATTTAYNNLSPNTQYLFQVKAQDTYSNTSSYSVATSTYTNAIAPTAISASNNGSASIIVSWTSTNGTGTNYQLYNVTTGAVVATTTATTYTVTGLTASTAYQFKVRAQYLSNNDTYTDYTTDSEAVTTPAASSGSSNSSSGGSAAPASSPPVAPVTAPVTAANAITLDLQINKPISQKIGASEHTFTAEAATAQNVRLKVQSDPIIVNLTVGVAQDIDTDNDTVTDLRIVYTGLKQGKPQIVTTNLTDENETHNALTIQAGAYETQSRNVILKLNSAGAVQMALSNSEDFSGAGFTTFAEKVKWTLTPGVGQKKVYAKLRSSQGGVITVSDTITLVGQGSVESPNSSNSSETITESPLPVTPLFKRVLKRGLLGTDVKQVQLELQNQGFLSKSIKANSVFGPATEAAVKAFEKKHGLKNDGVVDLIGWNALFTKQVLNVEEGSQVHAEIIKIILYSGASGVLVTEVQTKLQSLGYFPKSIKVNGYFGPATKKAVQAFQKANKISPTGNVGPLTWAALNK